MSVSAVPAETSSRPRASGLRPFALAVVVLAAVTALLRLGHAVLLLVGQGTGPLGLSAQYALLGAGMLSPLLAAAVVLLVQRSTTANGRVPSPVLLVLGLLTLALLATPLLTTLTTLLYVVLYSSGGVIGVLRLVPLVTDCFAVLCTLGLGVIALRLAVRGEAASRTGTRLGGSRALAVALCGLAVVAAVLLPVHLLILEVAPADSLSFAILTTAPMIVATSAHVLLTPVAALLIAQSTAWPRRLAWAVLIVLWVGGLLSSLAIGLLMFQDAVASEVDPGRYSLWNGLSTAAQATSGGIAVVLSVVVLVLVLLGRRSGGADAR